MADYAPLVDAANAEVNETILLPSGKEYAAPSVLNDVD